MRKKKIETQDRDEQAVSLWHTKSAKAVIEELNSNQEQGLSRDEAEQRLEQYGPNKLPETKPDSILTIFIRQFKSPLIYLLLGAAVVVLLLEEWIDGGIILFVLLFNAVVGTIQAGRAQNTLQALKRFTKTEATVIRNGEEIIISDEGVIPGDIIMLQEGDKIPADARVIVSHNLRASEAAMTGESDPVSKFSEPIDNPKAVTPDKKNMLFKGTHVVAGTGQAIVVSTGVNTVIGSISEQITDIESEMPLQSGVRYLSRIIIGVVLSVSAIIFVLGYFLRHFDITETFMLAVAVVVSAIPEGLPIVVTLLLATGVWRMSKRNVLVKKLQAVEALGEANVIAVDKTGTITKNELVVSNAFAGGRLFDVEGVGYETEGNVLLDGQKIKPEDYPELALLGKLGAFRANARLDMDEESGIWKVSGDPTEAAMLVFGEKIDLNRKKLHEQFTQHDEIPFDSKLKYHAVVHEVDGEPLVAVAGAPEILLKKCTRISEDGKTRKFTAEDRVELTKQFTELSKQGLRIIAITKKKHDGKTLDQADIKELTFVGFFAMKDAMRPEVSDAMEAAHSAGIRVVMITGDHKITAQAIAQEAGIFHEGDRVITDDEIEHISDEELAKRLGDATVFARITPEHKFRIVSAYRLRDEIVAMTGDGVNDALSLVAADLGVAMGKTGTEVAKEASDLILLDDNFGSIVSAVEEGRNIYKNLKKVLLYLFSTSLGELMTIIAAIAMGYPLPILAAQLLWLNLITDGLLDAALAMEGKEPGLLKGKFKRPKKWIVDGWMAQRMLLMSTTMAVVSLYIYIHYVDVDYAKATTMVLTTMAVFQWYKAFNCRSEHTSIFRMNPFGNKFLIAALAIIIPAQIAAIYTPFGQFILQVVPLTLNEWIVILTLSLSTILVDEIRKWFWRRFQDPDRKSKPKMKEAVA